MAEAPQKNNWETNTVELALLFILGAALLVAIFGTLGAFFSNVASSNALWDFLRKLYRYYTFIAVLMSALFATGIVYCFVRIGQISKSQAKLYDTLDGETSYATPEAEIKKHHNQKWERVKTLVESDNESDWRLAIIEADIMLDEMLSRMPYPGETLADKLKNVERSDFTTVESAWEAHKMRNTIAHEGAAFPLTQREARRVINLFEEVFREFFFI